MSQKFEVSRLRQHLETWGAEDLTKAEIQVLRDHFGDQTNALLMYYSN